MLAHENLVFSSNFFYAKQSLVKVRESHKVSGSYHKSLRNDLNLPGQKRPSQV